MNKRASILISIVICALVIVIIYFWTTALMNSVYAYRSPLHNNPPLPGEAVGGLNTRSVIIVLMDGLRYDTSLDPEVMPFLNELRTEGAYALMHSRPTSYSQTGYAVLLTGAWPDLADQSLINLEYDDIPTFTQDDVFSAAYRAGLLTAQSAYNWFEKMVPQNAITTSYYTPREDQIADRQVTDAAIPWLHEGKYDLVLIHLDQIDFAGHYEGGFLDQRWNAAATRADELLREIVSGMDLRQDTLLIVSDHGHLDRGGHGGQDAVVLMEPFVIAGKGVIPGRYGNIQMVDVAPTIAVILGTNIPASNQGKPRIEMLDLSLEQINQINQALSIQQGQLAKAYGDAINGTLSIAQQGDIVSTTQGGMDKARESRLNSERLPRGIIGIIFVILVINLASWHARPNFLWMLGGLVTYLAVFNAKYLWVDHKTYSLSSVTGSTDLIVSTAITTVVALFIGWLLVYIGVKAYSFRPGQAVDTTLKYILVTIAFISIPIAVNYIFNGVVVTWALPNFLLSFLGLIFMIQVLVIAAFGLILTGLSALIGLFSHWRVVHQEI